jgi:uncharacterized protein
MVRAQAKGMPVCLTVTHHDALVLARSGFHHSVNYRCVMAYGQARAVTDPVAKLRAMDAFVDRFYPGRTAMLRPPTTQEIKAINILEMEIEDAVAKIRATGVSDEEEDYAAPVWCAVLPLRTGYHHETVSSVIPAMQGHQRWLGWARSGIEVGGRVSGIVVWTNVTIAVR